MSLTSNVKVNEKKYQAVTSLDAPSRYDHFIKVVADRECVWGLYSNGWLLQATNDDNTVVFCLWPERIYAERYFGDDDRELEPSEISIDDLFDELLPNLKAENIKLCIFPVRDGGGPVVPYDLFEDDLRNELSRY